VGPVVGLMVRGEDQDDQQEDRGHDGAEGGKDGPDDAEHVAHEREGPASEPTCRSIDLAHG
jgi:hypothetical protein